MSRKQEPIYIGSRVEMMIDDTLVGQTFNTALKLNPPVPREIAIRMDQPWEGLGSGVYACMFHDGEKYRLYYRASAAAEGGLNHDLSDTQYNCVAFSADGIHWEKPNLGQVEFRGSKDNNILFSGQMAHNFSPMPDPRPECPPDERYKAVAGHAPKGLMAYKSADGLHWQPLQEEPVITEGAFDSHNLCLYDESRKQFRCYSRYFATPAGYERSKVSLTDGERAAGSPIAEGALTVGVRAIQSCTSPDFIHWTDPEPNRYHVGVPQDQFYTNATLPCPGAEHHFLSFPMRFVSERQKIMEHPKVGVSDAVFMSSRDGVNFDRPFTESWIRPGLDRRNWTERNFITAWGIAETSPEEFSLYVCEHYEWDDAYIRRYSVRRHGFGSMNAPYAGGMFVTKPFIFEGSKLHLNYATGAPGSIRVGIVADETGWPASGYSTEECDIIYGNELDAVVTWKGNADLSKFAGKKVALKFEMKDADLYSFHFGD